MSETPKPSVPVAPPHVGVDPTSANHPAGIRAADLGGRKLIDLRTDDWLRFATDRPEIRCLERLEGSFQWVGRETDVLLRAVDPEAGEFLVIIELQLRPDARMPLRLEVYAALAEQKFGLPVYPVVVIILPGGPTDLDHYESEILELTARRGFRVIRLWEQDARQVVDGDVVGLLPYVPVMIGGDDPDLLALVLNRLRRTPELAGMEMLLAYVAGLVLSRDQVLKLMRWDMAVMQGLTLYQEILSKGIEEGLEQGIEQGRREAALLHLKRILAHRFGPASRALASELDSRDGATLEHLIDVALDIASLAAFRGALPE